MSLLMATQVTAVATAVLALFAIITAVFAYLAYQTQTEEVRTLQKQLDDQRQINDKQTEVLELQARELKESLEQREREAGERRRSQAAHVTAWFGLGSSEVVPAPAWGAIVRNASDLPVIDVRVSYHYIAEEWPGGDWRPVFRGSPPEKIRVLPPKETRFVEIPEQVRNMIGDVSDQVCVVSAEFTDAYGNRWERDPRGALIARS